MMDEETKAEKEDGEGRCPWRNAEVKRTAWRRKQRNSCDSEWAWPPRLRHAAL